MKQKLNKNQIRKILSLIEQGDTIDSIDRSHENISRSSLFKLKKLMKTLTKDQIVAQYPDERPKKSQLIKTLHQCNNLLDASKLLKLNKRQLEYLLKKYEISFNQILDERAQLGDTKRCSDCGIQKSKNDFYSASFESRDGLSNYCKECFLKKQKISREKNKSKIKNRNQKYRLKTRTENPELFLNQRKRYANTANGMYSKLKKSERARPQIEVRISKEEFSAWYDGQIKRCGYCQIDLATYQHLVSKTDLWMLKHTYSFGTDRMNSDGHYETKNIILCCPLCNYLKGYVFSFDDFSKIAEKYVTTFWRNIS
jgi:hypothetical protein